MMNLGGVLSSILKALKRLETDTDSRKPSRGLPGIWRERPTTEDPPPIAVSPPLFRTRYGRFTIIATILVIGLLLLWRPAPQEPGPVVHKVTETLPAAQTLNKPVSTSIPSPPSPTPSPTSNPTLAHQVPAKPQNQRQANPAATAPSPPAPRTPDTTQGVKSNSGLPAEPAARPQPPPPIPAAKKTIATVRVGSSQTDPPPPAKAPPPKKQAKPKPSAPKRNDPRITIQAIAWSRYPDERMAVVNGSILKEGDTLAGIAVKTIEEDGVTFTEGGRWWKQSP